MLITTGLLAASLLTAADADVIISKGGIRTWSPAGLSEPLLMAPEGGAASVPAITPDGSMMAFGSNRDGGWRLYLAPPFSPEWTELATLSRDYLGKIEWAADGRRILYEVDGHTVGENSVWTLDTGQAEPAPRRLTAADGVDLDPAWSPDGESIIVATATKQEVQSYADMIWVERTTELDLIDAADGTRSRLTDLGEHISDPAFSPDNTRIAFLADGALKVLRLRDRAVTELAKGLAPGAIPHWSPDGTQIVIAGNAVSSPTPPGGAQRARKQATLVVATLTDNSTRTLRLPIGECYHCDFSPDGQSILATGEKKLIRIDVESGESEQVLDGLDFWSIVQRVPVVHAAADSD